MSCDNPTKKNDFFLKLTFSLFPKKLVKTSRKINLISVGLNNIWRRLILRPEEHLHMVFGMNDIQSKGSKWFIYFGEWPVARSKPANEHDMLKN